MILPRVIVGGQQMPIESFTITGGAYGSVGSLVAVSSLKAMAQVGFDLVAASIASPGSLPVDIFVTDTDSVDEDVHLFGGEYVTGDYDYDADSVTVHARDWAGPLVDQKRVLTNILGGGGALAPDEAATSGVSTQNQSLTNVITAIAQQFDLTPDIRLNSNISNGNADVGAIFGNTSDTIMTSVPQTLWGLLNRLAKQSGNIVYVTPQKSLVFGAPGEGVQPLSLTYRQNGSLGVSLMKLRITHNPRRNLTFRVMVLSYDPTVQQMTTGQAYVIGANYSTDDGGTVQAGAWGGAQAAQIASSVGTGASSKKNAIPIYTYHIDGLTASQAQSRAESIAADIAKRELVAHCKTDVITEMVPGQQGTIAGLINPEFATHTYFVTAYNHRFSIGSRGSSTFESDFTMLDRQPEGQGVPTKKAAPVG